MTLTGVIPHDDIKSKGPRAYLGDTRQMHYHYAKEAQHSRWDSNPRSCAHVRRTGLSVEGTRVIQLRYWSRGFRPTWTQATRRLKFYAGKLYSQGRVHKSSWQRYPKCYTIYFSGLTEEEQQHHTGSKR